MNNFACLKCKKNYEEEDTEAYYCPTCLKEKKKIAKEIDSKIQSRQRIEPRSLLQEYEAAPKAHGFMIVKL